MIVLSLQFPSQSLHATDLRTAYGPIQPLLKSTIQKKEFVLLSLCLNKAVARAIARTEQNPIALDGACLSHQWEPTPSYVQVCPEFSDTHHPQFGAAIALVKN